MSLAPKLKWTVAFAEVEQQERHVCAYFAIYHTVNLLTDDAAAAQQCLPPRDEWQIDLTSCQVEALLQNAMQTEGCGAICDTVFIVEQVMCLLQCSTVIFPTLRKAVDVFLSGEDVALVVNCQDAAKVVNSYLCWKIHNLLFLSGRLQNPGALGQYRAIPRGQLAGL